MSRTIERKDPETGTVSCRVCKDDVFLKSGGADAGTTWIQDGAGLRLATEAEIGLCMDLIPGFSAARRECRNIAS